MTNAEQVQNVLEENGVELSVEAQRDGSAVVRDESASTEASSGETGGSDAAPTFPVTDELNKAVDTLTEAGFVVAMVKDDDDNVQIIAR